jgi:hypothetical protein
MCRFRVLKNDSLLRSEWLMLLPITDNGKPSGVGD